VRVRRKKARRENAVEKEAGGIQRRLSRTFLEWEEEEEE
jgi:hypothetical protein